MGIVFVKNYGKIEIGNNFKASSGSRYNPIGGDTILRIICRKGTIIRIGDNVGISNSTLHICEELIIGDNVMIGGGCKIWDSDFHSLNLESRIVYGDNEVITRPVHIEDNVFIGVGSVVSTSVPANQIWAGNPAKFIRII